MVLRVDVMDATLRAHYGVDPVSLRATRRVIALAPTGRLLDDALVGELAGEPALTFLCGRYEGFDERIVEHYASDVISVGRYVLAGGELAAMVCVDAVLRRLPGALGHPGSAVEESFSDALEGLPEYPHYTRPAEFRGWRGAGDPALGPPRGDPPLAPRAGARAGRARRRAEARRARIHAARRRVSSLRLLFAMSTIIDSIERAQLRRVPSFQAGDRLRVHFLVIEGTRRRTQVFEGVAIKRQGNGARETFTVRKQSFGVGVERTFPLHSPKIEKIEVAARGDVRRAKLYYLRDRVGKARARPRARLRRPRGDRPARPAQPAARLRGSSRRATRSRPRTPSRPRCREVEARRRGRGGADGRGGR